MAAELFQLGGVRMKTFVVWGVGASLVLTTACSCFAQMMLMPNMPGHIGYWHPVVGSGAVYELHIEGDPIRTIEVDIVGQGNANGKEGVWLEFTTDAPKALNSRGGQMVIREAVVFDATALRMQVVQSIMQFTGATPWIMPKGKTQSIQYTDVRKSVDDLGGEVVTTGGGTLSCEHYRTKDGSGDFWVSEQVAPSGLVKFDGKSQGRPETITLTKTVTDAKDRIKGTPYPFDFFRMSRERAIDPSEFLPLDPFR
jgi:hypothetical protein